MYTIYTTSSDPSFSSEEGRDSRGGKRSGSASLAGAEAIAGALKLNPEEQSKRNALLDVQIAGEKQCISERQRKQCDDILAMGSSIAARVSEEFYERVKVRRQELLEKSIFGDTEETERNVRRRLSQSLIKFQSS